MSTVRKPLELWAGIECTVNRVGDEYFDQVSRSSHDVRLPDLDLFAGLGIRAMRYPVLWERIAPRDLQSADWSWPGERLARLRQLNIRPIAGLLHHGSGPRYTSLLDPNFPRKLAAFARAVAERYPWIEDYTPVNEPLTTARFSGLYGHWYPHGRDELTFATAFVSQCRAIVLAMREIRKINPKARLIQTEDMGKTFSTRTLAYQAEFENERRWLTFDLLCGRIDRDHPMWDYLEWAGLPSADVEWFLENHCTPNVIGINHYLTSERFLDERLHRYPEWSHGGNGVELYADVEAVRVRAEGAAGPQALLREVWKRYRLPLAVTEAHLGCTRDEQLRWIKEIWEGAEGLRREGADVRAVTAWSLLGAYDWSSLLTESEDKYEPGVFDLRGPQPRATALAGLLKDLAAGKKHSHPVLDAPGWWRRNARLLYPAVGKRPLLTAPSPARPLLITGASGTLGRATARICALRGLPCHVFTRQDMDIADTASVGRQLQLHHPWAVINGAGFVRVDEAETESSLCMRENTRGPETLAAACVRHGIPLLTFSSDLVFDGSKGRPYVESDLPTPLNCYGRSKAEAEAAVLRLLPSALVIRTSAFFGPWDEYNFVTGALRTLRSGGTVVAAHDAVVSPTYVPDLVNASLDLLIDGERGIWHLANPGSISWYELARLAAGLYGLDGTGIHPRATESLQLTAVRPAYSVLGSERGVMLPPLEDAIVRYIEEGEVVLFPEADVVRVAS